jgi:hypothetical protein
MRRQYLKGIKLSCALVLLSIGACSAQSFNRPSDYFFSQQTNAQYFDHIGAHNLSSFQFNPSTLHYFRKKQIHPLAF